MAELATTSADKFSALRRRPCATAPWRPAGAAGRDAAHLAPAEPREARARALTERDAGAISVPRPPTCTANWPCPFWRDCRRAEATANPSRRTRHMNAMTRSSTDLPHVDATLNYLGADGRTAAQLHVRSAGRVPRSNIVNARPHTVPIHDVRSGRRPCRRSIARASRCCSNPSAVHDFWDEDEVRRVYYPEAAAGDCRGDRRQQGVHFRPYAAPARARRGRSRCRHATPAGDARACRPHGEVRTAAGARLFRR